MLANLFILSEIIMFTIYMPQNSRNSQVDLEYYFHFRKIHMKPLSSSFSLDICLEENRGLCLLDVKPRSCCPQWPQPTARAPRVCLRTAFLQIQLGILAENWHFLRNWVFHRTIMFQMNLWQTQAEFQKQFPRFPAQTPKVWYCKEMSQRGLSKIKWWSGDLGHLTMPLIYTWVLHLLEAQIMRAVTVISDLLHHLFPVSTSKRKILPILTALTHSSFPLLHKNAFIQCLIQGFKPFHMFRILIFHANRFTGCFTRVCMCTFLLNVHLGRLSVQPSSWPQSTAAKPTHGISLEWWCQYNLCNIK